MDKHLDSTEKKFPKGHFVGIGMVIGIAISGGIGITLSILTENFGFIGIGPAIGVALGMAIGQSIENKYQRKGRIRPLNAVEKKERRILTMVGLALFTLGILVFTLIYLRK